MLSDKKTVQDFIAILEAKGLADIIITPGSRNAPFSISFFEHPAFRTLSIIDERSAAFFALGMAQQTGRPVVLICTSGTASLNFAPAIAEACYQRIPLLVVTADRPVEWVDQGEGQTIRQTELFANYVKYSFGIIQEADDHDLIWHNQRIINTAVDLCTNGVKGPVHLNFPLRESLYRTVSKSSGSPKIISTSPLSADLEKDEWNRLLSKIDDSEKILIICGQLESDKDLAEALSVLSSDKRIAVLTESHSNLSDSGFIGTIDRLIMGFGDDEKTFLRPDLLITIGHNIISRKIKAFLRDGDFEHWHIDESGECLDTFQHLNRIVPLKPRLFLKGWSVQHRITLGNYAAILHSMHEANRRSADEFIATAPFSDLTAVADILAAIPSASHLQMGNSAVVRYIQLVDPRPDLEYFANRGVSGIDGCTSTAAGAAFSSNKLTTLITGDIAFFYDSNAFWNNYVSSRLKVIVLNNAGGGIFRIIEGPSSTPALEAFFETHHTRTAEGMASMYHIPYSSAVDSDSLKNGLEWLYALEGCAILEVHTPRLENDSVLKAYFNHIKNKQLSIKNESI